jgi:hypothetical protein
MGFPDEDSTGKFFPIAAFDLPPLDPALRSMCDGWLMPIWTSRYANNAASSQESSNMDSSITAEDIMYNL